MLAAAIAHLVSGAHGVLVRRPAVVGDAVDGGWKVWPTILSPVPQLVRGGRRNFPVARRSGALLVQVVEPGKI